MLESKRRAMIFLLLAFILAAIAGYLVFDKVKTLNSQLGGMTKIYVAAGDIPSRTLITENQIKTIEMPNRYVSKSYVTDMNKLVNQVVVVPLNKEDIITKNMLKPATELRKANDRLVAMYRSDKIQFDQVVATNDRVDIIVSTEENGQKKTEIFMRDVPVAWAQGEGSKFVGAALEVSLENAPKLINMENYADHIRVLKANVGKEEDNPAKETQVVTEQQTNQNAANTSDNKNQAKDTNNKENNKQKSEGKSEQKKGNTSNKK
ncbi:flagella basal body P-ring formation protein FlgA [Bacillus sp. APMAM]|nr:flagella basal body P-ring formation protein FlgA [Bacillus sp. APMAM]RTZ54783.1 flp pilus assembly protein CpaB [Bacillus sp. SAJ1]